MRLLAGVEGVWISDIGRVGQTELVVGQLELEQKTSVLLFDLGGGSTKSPVW